MTDSNGEVWDLKAYFMSEKLSPDFKSSIKLEGARDYLTAFVEYANGLRSLEMCIKDHRTTLESSPIFRDFVIGLECDKQGKTGQALQLYTQGLEKCLAWRKGRQGTGHDEARKIAEIFITRAEGLKNVAASRRGFKCLIDISDGARGFSYRTVFSPFVNKYVNEVTICDPYIRTYVQIANLLRFIEVLLLRTSTIKQINLKTVRDPEPDKAAEQMSNLRTLQISLEDRDVHFEVSFSSTLHDRSISFSDGLQFILGRGLDYFKSLSQKKFQPGAYELDLRPCYETSINIFYG